METTTTPPPALILRILNFPIVRLALLCYVFPYRSIAGYQFPIPRTRNPWISLGVGLVVAAHLLFANSNVRHFTP